MGTVRLATRGSPLALRQTEEVAGLLRRGAPRARDRAGRRAHAGRPRRVLVARPDRRPRCLRHRGGGGGERRTGRRRRAFRQGHALDHAGPLHPRRGAPEGRRPRRPGRRARWPRSRPAASSPPGRRGAAPSWPTSGPTSSSPTCEATWPAGWPPARTGASRRSSSPSPRWSDWAGTRRLSDVLDPMDLLPQAGQGAIAVQCRADDDGDAPAARRPSTTQPSHRALRAERAVLADPRRQLHRARGSLRRSR